MKRPQRMFILAASVLLITIAKPQPAAAAREAGVCEAVCWSAWVLCIFTVFPYCNPMLEGCLAGCEFPH